MFLTAYDIIHYAYYIKDMGANLEYIKKGQICIKNTPIELATPHNFFGIKYRRI